MNWSLWGQTGKRSRRSWCLEEFCFQHEWGNDRPNLVFVMADWLLCVQLFLNFSTEFSCTRERLFPHVRVKSNQLLLFTLVPMQYIAKLKGDISVVISDIFKNSQFHNPNNAITRFAEDHPYLCTFLASVAVSTAVLGLTRKRKNFYVPRMTPNSKHTINILIFLW